MKLKAPSWVTTVLALLAGALSVLNQTTFDLGSPWRNVLAIALVFIAGLGIGPLTGSAFRTALHLSQNLSVLISSGLGALSIIVVTIHMSTGVHAVILFVITTAAGLGFGTTPTPAQLQNLLTGPQASR